MTDEIKTETNTGSEVKKTEDPLALLAQISKQNSDAIADLKKTTAAILTKLEDANPVEHGARMEAKPKESDEKEVGAEITASNDYGRSEQASIIAPADKPNTSDSSGLSMENKGEVKKTLDSVYKEIPSVRPAFAIMKAESNTVVPTALQFLKAFESGFDGKFKKASDSYDELVLRLQNGDFGTGFPRSYF